MLLFVSELLKVFDPKTARHSVALDSWWSCQVLDKQLVLKNPDDKDEACNSQGRHDKEDEHPAAPSLVNGEVPILPDNICWLLSLLNLDIFVQKGESVDFQSLVVSVLSMERTEKHLWDEKLLKVLILVICHLLLNFLGLFKVAFT